MYIHTPSQAAGEAEDIMASGADRRNAVQRGSRMVGGFEFGLLVGLVSECMELELLKEYEEK